VLLVVARLGRVGLVDDRGVDTVVDGRRAGRARRRAARRL